DNAGAQIREMVDAADHFRGWNRRRGIVVFVTVGAGEIAAPDGDDVSENRMVRGAQTIGDHSPFPEFPLRGNQTSPNAGAECRHIRNRKHYYSTCPIYHL